MKVLVIGGGASGMMAALTAAQHGHNVTLLERQSRVGRKLLATGNGRCNLTNLGAHVKNYHGSDAQFVAPALKKFNVEQTLDYFRSLGLLTVAEDSGKVYPFSDQANSVVDVLRFALERLGVDVHCSCEVLSVGKKAGGFQAKTAEERFYGDKLIIACGGAAGSKLGGTDFGYKFLESFGHKRTAISPSLVQLRTDTAFTRSLKGVRAQAALTLKDGGRAVGTTAGEVQFTDFGISGPAVFELSRKAGQCEKPLLLLDFLPILDEAALTALLEKKQSDAPAEDFLTGLLHNRLGKVILQTGGWELNAASRNIDCQKLAHLIKFYPLTVTGLLGLEHAQVTAGGIQTGQFRPDTLESKLHPGLFATGEVLDIDGDCGGYNLQWAWSSGHVAGMLGA